MEKLKYLLLEGFKNIWRHKMTTLTSIFSLFIIVYIVLILATFGNNTHKLLHYLRSKYKIEVFFNQTVSNEEAVAHIHKIKSIEGVRTATIIEKGVLHRGRILAVIGPSQTKKGWCMATAEAFAHQPALLQ